MSAASGELPAATWPRDSASRGRLKIFFGYAAGVGKTFTMLEAARRQAASGVDVVVGYVEPHGRPETEALLQDLEQVPTRELHHHGIRLQDFNLEQALERRPQLILVDELAHSNPPDSRHPKRYGDVLELLDAGIDVYTTLNVQHLESLNDLISQITGVMVRETVPDAVFDEAAEVELVDLPPEELLQRFAEGKVYVPEQARRAMQSFFRRTNLTALREIALRRTADRVGEQGRSERLGEREPTRWGSNEHLLVCVVPRLTSARVIRAGRRLASALRARWSAVYVETPGTESLSPEAKEGLLRNLRLAERLGASTVMLHGDDVTAEILAWANRNDVTKIVLGQDQRPSWWHRLTGSQAERLLRASGDIDVYLTHARKPEGGDHHRGRAPSPRVGVAGWLWTGVALATSLAVATSFFWLGFQEANIIMVFLPAVVFAAMRYGLPAGGVAAVASVLAFDFFFTPPYLTFVTHDVEYGVTFLVMLVVAAILAALATRLRRQAERAREQQQLSEALYRLTDALAERGSPRRLAELSERRLGRLLDAEVGIFLPDGNGLLRPLLGGANFAARPHEVAVAQWVLEHAQVAGRHSDNLPQAEARYLPLIGSGRTVGVIGIRPNDPDPLAEPERGALLQTCLGQIGSAIARESLAEEARQATLAAETERMRSALLATVSHDLRTPLTAMAGAASTLSQPGEVPAPLRRELATMIEQESRRMARLVENLLAMSRLEQREVTRQLEWLPLEEVVGSALNRAEGILSGRPVAVRLAPEPPLMAVDGVLIEQLLLNLLENAARYTPAGSAIEIDSRRDGDFVVVSVRDHGPGVNAADAERIFEKFVRGVGAASAGRGSGLGLAICKAIVEVHGGRIWVDNAPDGGARFQFSLPWAGWPPQPVPELELMADGR